MPEHPGYGALWPSVIKQLLLCSVILGLTSVLTSSDICPSYFGENTASPLTQLCMDEPIPESTQAYYDGALLHLGELTTI